MNRTFPLAAVLFLLASLALLPACSTGSREGTSPAGTATLVPAVYLDELSPLKDSVGYGRLGVGVYGVPDPLFEGKPLFAQGQAWPHGLMTHAPALVQYDLDGRYRLFRSALLSKEGVQCGDGVAFQVLLDGQNVYTSPTVTAFSSPLQVELDVSDARTLTLVVNPLKSSDCDWAIWGAPLLVPVGGLAVGYPTATTRPTLTPDPDLPCGSSQPGRTYLILDCSEVLLIREQIHSGDADLGTAWNALVSITDNYRANFPTSFNPDDSSGVLWWGPGNHIAADMALIYLVTGDRAYGRDILRLLELVVSHMPVLDVQPGYYDASGIGLNSAGGLLSAPPLGEGPFQSLLFAYFAVRDDSFLNSGQQAQYDTFFQNQARLLEAAAKSLGNDTLPDSPVNRNVPVGANISALTIAAAYPEDAAMQDLAARVRPTFEWQLANWWEKDGGWGEHTNQYGFRIFRAILYLAETLRHNSGDDLYQVESGGTTIPGLCKYWLEVVTPEGDPPSINDTGFGYFEPGTLMLCARRTGDPGLTFAAAQYLWGFQHAFGVDATQGNSPLETLLWWEPGVVAGPQPPEWTSTLLPDSGLGIFRSDWSHDAQYGLLKFTSSLVHNHFSFGELLLYDHGPWLVGNGYHTDDLYDLSVATRSASTLTLDDSRQRVPGGKLVAFEPFDQTGYMAVTAQSYAALDHTRNVLWLPGYHQWLIVDDAVMSSPAGHKVQVRWYVRGVETGYDGNGTWQFTRPDYPGSLTLRMPSALTPTYTSIQRAFEGDPGDAAGVEIEVRPEIHTRILTSLAFSAGEPSGYPTLQRDDSGNGLRITSQPAAGAPTWEWLLAAPGSRNAASGDLVLDGRVGCTWHEGDALAGFCLYAGSALDAGELLLVESAQPLSIEVDLAANRIRVDTGAETRLRVYWPEDVVSIRENGKAVPFQQADGLLFLELTAGEHTLEITLK